MTTPLPIPASSAQPEPEYLILHFWTPQGGFGNRLQSLLMVLQERARVIDLRTPLALLKALLRGQLWRHNTHLVFFTSLIAPIVLFLKLLCPSLKAFYFVRGDEITWAHHHKRKARARLAFFFQWLLNTVHCVFVFVSKDLESLFEKRLGSIHKKAFAPNTLGIQLPPIRPFDGRVTLVGDFRTVKNIEGALARLESGNFLVDLYGNTSLPCEWERPWLTAHGVVRNLPECLKHSTMVVFTSSTEGFPNVLLDALKAGCAVLVPFGFPFEYLPISPAWRFALSDTPAKEGPDSLEQVLLGHYSSRRDFKADNKDLIRLVESDWRAHVWKALC